MCFLIKLNLFTKNYKRKAKYVEINKNLLLINKSVILDQESVVHPIKSNQKYRLPSMLVCSINFRKTMRM